MMRAHKITVSIGRMVTLAGCVMRRCHASIGVDVGIVAAGAAVCGMPKWL